DMKGKSSAERGAGKRLSGLAIAVGAMFGFLVSQILFHSRSASLVHFSDFLRCCLVAVPRPDHKRAFNLAYFRDPACGCDDQALLTDNPWYLFRQYVSRAGSN